MLEHEIDGTECMVSGLVSLRRFLALMRSSTKSPGRASVLTLTFSGAHRYHSQHTTYWIVAQNGTLSLGLLL